MRQSDPDSDRGANRNQLLDLFLVGGAAAWHPEHRHADLRKTSSPSCWGNGKSAFLAERFDSFLKECGVPTGILANIPASPRSLLADMERNLAFKDVKALLFSAVDVRWRPARQEAQWLSHMAYLPFVSSPVARKR